MPAPIMYILTIYIMYSLWANFLRLASLIYIFPEHTCVNAQKKSGPLQLVSVISSREQGGTSM